MSLQAPHPALIAAAGEQSLGRRKYVWGGVSFPPKRLAPHFAVLGITGSGKTLTQRMLMSSVLPMKNQPAFRALIYDPKREFFPILVGMGIAPQHIIVTHPLDTRGTAWDIAADVNDNVSAKEIAETLAPIDQSAHDPYWSTTARQTVHAVINTFIELAPGRWTLRDIVEACTYRPQLELVLGATAKGRRVLESHFARAESAAASIFSTVSSKVEDFAEIAALWEQSRYTVSLRQWMDSRSILLLGSHPDYETTLEPLSRMIFRRISKLIRSRSEEEPSDETWIFFDEVREAGKVAGLRELLTTGRSKGARVVLGFQDRKGIQAVYGDPEAQELIGLCGNVGVLSLSNPETAKWASEFFGEYEYFQESESLTVDHNGNESRSTTKSIAMRSAVIPQELLRMPLARRKEGFGGVFTNPYYGMWQEHLTGEFIDRHLHLKADERESPGYNQRPNLAVEQRLRAWDDEDLKRLNIRRAGNSARETSRRQPMKKFEW